jgi:type I restriction enzyme S subunit
MSSKIKNTARQEESKPALVPRLRFPEFRGAGAWTTETLGSVVKISTAKVGDKTCIPMSITSGVGLVSQMEKFGRIIAGSSYANYLQLKKNDFAYNKSATKEYPEGFIALYSGYELAAVPNSIFTCFRVIGDSPVPQYLNYLFLGNLHGRWLRKFIEVGARAHGSLSINDDDLLALPVPLPRGTSSVAEQHKIAECLSSVDELLAAQARKVDALKTHKKGLMQQLFPREGETQPRLRFPEFQNAGEWTRDALGNVCTVLNNRRRPITSGDRKPGPFRYYGASGVVDYVDDFIFDERVVLVGEDGAKWGAFERTAFIVEGKFWVNNHAHVLKPHGLNDALLENYLTMVDLAPFVAGAAPPKLTLGKLKEIPVPIPPDEEEGKAIATCLSSLDALITAETQKHEALKTHKKGLMQQLFPSPENEL